MKKMTTVLLIGVSLLCGCAHQYVITLDNGRRITTASKPKLKEQRYVFKDATGKLGYISAARVREIAPASMSKESDGPVFNPQPKRN